MGKISKSRVGEPSRIDKTGGSASGSEIVLSPYIVKNSFTGYLNSGSGSVRLLKHN